MACSELDTYGRLSEATGILLVSRNAQSPLLFTLFNNTFAAHKDDYSQSIGSSCRLPLAINVISRPEHCNF